MTYLENWNNIKKSLINIVNEEPYCIFYDKHLHLGIKLETREEILKDYNSCFSDKPAECIADIWEEVEGRNSLILRSPESRLEYATFLSEPLVLNKFILVGVNILDVDLEELETTLQEIRVYLK